VKKIIALILCVAFITVLSSNFLLASDEEPFKGQRLYTRTNLMRDGKIIYFHNMRRSKGSFPVGTEVIITGGTGWGNQIVFKLARNNWMYFLKVPPEEYKKYFVEDISEIGLQDLGDEALKNIKNMSIVPGMTKEEVYISRGCPAYIGYGVKSWGRTLSQVMESDTWYYHRTTMKKEMLVKFNSDVVAEIERY